MRHSTNHIGFIVAAAVIFALVLAISMAYAELIEVGHDTDMTVLIESDSIRHQSENMTSVNVLRNYKDRSQAVHVELNCRRPGSQVTLGLLEFAQRDMKGPISFTLKGDPTAPYVVEDDSVSLNLWRFVCGL